MLGAGLGCGGEKDVEREQMKRIDECEEGEVKPLVTAERYVLIASCPERLCRR